MVHVHDYFELFVRWKKSRHITRVGVVLTIHVAYVNLGDEVSTVLVYVFVHILCITTSNHKILVAGGNMFDCKL